MVDDVKRPYRSPLRADAARRTRALIRDSAARLFADQGYVSTTVREIAAAAGVALRTTFAVFPGGKPEMFHEALDVAIAGDEQPVAMGDRPEFAAMLADPATLLDRYVSALTELLERAGGLIMTMIESAGADAEMRRLEREGAAANLANTAAVATALHHHGLLRAGVTIEHATDVLFALGSPHMHALLRYERGWPVARYQEWLRATVAATLLG